MFVHVQCDVVNCYRPIGFLIVTFDVCLKWEFPWSCMRRSVYSSMLNFDGPLQTNIERHDEKTNRAIAIDHVTLNMYKHPIKSCFISEYF
jgi:hypothetical protein